MAEYDYDQPVVCISHNDLDGMGAASVVKKRYPNAKIFYSNYGRPTPPQAFINGAKLFVTDFTLPEMDFEKAQRLGMSVIWLDHHAANYKPLESKGITFPGLRMDSACGALLTWKFLYPNIPPPRTLLLVDDYDRWQFKFPETKAFNAGIAVFEQRVSFRNCYIWNELLSDDPNVVERRLKIVCDIGEKILAYNAFRHKVACTELAYVTEFMGKKVLVANTKQANSMFFDSVDPELRKTIDALCVIQYGPDIKRYRASFYSPDNVKVVVHLAQQFPGGGGHPGAAGFNTPDYPFPIQPGATRIPMEKVIGAYQSVYKRRDNIYANQSACRADKISLTSSTFKTVFCRQPTMAINHPYITELLNGYFHTVDVINPEDGNPYHYFLGWSLTRDGWYRVGFWTIDQSITNCNSLELMKDVLKNNGIEYEELYEEKPGGILGTVFWFYTKTLPINIPIRR